MSFAKASFHRGKKTVDHLWEKPMTVSVRQKVEGTAGKIRTKRTSEKAKRDPLVGWDISLKNTQGDAGELEGRSLKSGQNTPRDKEIR